MNRPLTWTALTALAVSLLFVSAATASEKPDAASEEAAAEQGPAAFSGFTEVKLFGGCRIPALVVTNKGTLLAFCERRNTSSDSGDNDVWCKTREKLKVLHPARDASSSDMAVLPDTSIGLLYETNATGWQSIWFARFTREWLTDGKDRINPGK